MRKIKQIFAQGELTHTVIDEPMNEFIATLPQHGEEILEIQYISDMHGNIYSALVLYDTR